MTEKDIAQTDRALDSTMPEKTLSSKALSPKALTPEAQRALKEAQDRRQKADDPTRPKEIGGQKGPDPARYGDWEKDGIISDF